MQNTSEDSFLNSSLSVSGIHTENEILEWVQRNLNRNKYSITLKSLSQLSNWNYVGDFESYRHVSGKFFDIAGLHIQLCGSNYNKRWCQPIINQPEVGVLGFISKKLNGVLHILAQAKMEPGNINLIQISPTVQATESNYTQAHGGRKPKFIEYFIGKPERKILLDQLQSEQGSRYLLKRNRNVIIEVPTEENIEFEDDFIWITIGQLQKLMRYPNLVHLDCRSIIGSISYRSINMIQNWSFTKIASLTPSLEYIFGKDELNLNLNRAFEWKKGQKNLIQLERKLVPLNQLDQWTVDNNGIRHNHDKYFSVLGVAVSATNREVAGWEQPLISSKEGGVIGLLAQNRDGILRFLIQALPEPGLNDLIELAATVQFTPGNYSAPSPIPLPEFTSFFTDQIEGKILFDGLLSDEGGRFYHSMQRHIIIMLSDDLKIDIPRNYYWMSLTEIQAFAHLKNQVNIELRSIISCLSLT
jgi:oxidase EvaA